MTYVPIGIRSEYSFHDGMCRVQELVERARSLKMDAVGVGDLNSTYAWAPLEAAARNAGIQPVFGVRVLLSTQAVRVQPGAAGASTVGTSELLLYATSASGLRNLMRLVSQAHLEGDEVTHAGLQGMSITMQDLEQASEGVLALDGGAQGLIQQSLRRGDVQGARRALRTFQDIFADGCFFIQIERQGTPEELRIEPMLRRMARRSGVGLVAVNDTCYLDREDAEAYDVLRCLGSQRTLQDLPDDAAMEAPFGTKRHLRSPSEMQRLYQDVPEALEASRHIAELCRLDLPEILEGVYARSSSEANARAGAMLDLRQRCETGACERFDKTRYQDVPAAARTRIAHELAMIEEKELASCFLVAQDVVRYAKEEGIPVGPGRGSLAGSLVAYVLDMTDIDPMHHDLLFDGRLSKSRPGVPGIDLEVGHRWRDAVLQKVQEVAGRHRVVRMSSLAHMQGRSLLHNVGRTLNVSSSTLETVDRLSRAHASKKVHESLDRSNRLRRLFQDDPQARRLLEVCSRLEGLPYHATLHAGGLLLLPGEAMQRVALETSSQGHRAQATEEQAEHFGWTRIVVHGSSHLSAQAGAEKWIQQQQPEFELDSIPVDDEATWRRIAHGDGNGLPGLELPVARNVVRAVQPSRLSDLVACLTLASPVAQGSGLTERFLSTGRSGRVPEVLRDILDETGGWVLYEEQVVHIAERIAGYTLEQAWEFCEALRSDDLSRLVAQRPRFLSGALERGHELPFAERVLDTLMAVRMGGESRGHAMAQALVAYRTAWMLTHHSLETLVELLNNSIGQSARQQRVLRMAVDQGCRILKVDVNRSEEGYLVEDGAIRLAMSHVPSVGEATAAALVAARHRGGVFESVQDVLMRVPGLHRMQVDALVEAGAFANLRDASLAHDSSAAASAGEAGPAQGSGAGEKTSQETTAPTRSRAVGVARVGSVSSNPEPRRARRGDGYRGRSRRSRRVSSQMILNFDAATPCQQGAVESVEAKPLAVPPVVPESPARQRDSRAGRSVTPAAGGRMWVVGTLFGRSRPAAVEASTDAPTSADGQGLEARGPRANGQEANGQEANGQEANVQVTGGHETSGHQAGQVRDGSVR